VQKQSDYCSRLLGYNRPMIYLVLRVLESNMLYLRVCGRGVQLEDAAAHNSVIRTAERRRIQLKLCYYLSYSVFVRRRICVNEASY